MDLSTVFTPSASEQPLFLKTSGLKPRTSLGFTEYVKSNIGLNICLKDGGAVQISGLSAKATFTSDPAIKGVRGMTLDEEFSSRFQYHLEEKLNPIFKNMNTAQAQQLLSTWRTGQTDRHRLLRGALQNGGVQRAAENAARDMAVERNHSVTYETNVGDTAVGYNVTNDSPTPCNIFSGMQGPTGLG